MSLSCGGGIGAIAAGRRTSVRANRRPRSHLPTVLEACRRWHRLLAEEVGWRIVVLAANRCGESYCLVPAEDREGAGGDTAGSASKSAQITGVGDHRWTRCRKDNAGRFDSADPPSEKTPLFAVCSDGTCSKAPE